MKHPRTPLERHYAKVRKSKAKLTTLVFPQDLREYRQHYQEDRQHIDKVLMQYSIPE